MSKLLREVDLAVTIAGKLAKTAAALGVVGLFAVSLIVPADELDFICDHVWTEFKFKHLGIPRDEED